jgi:hypothetical protein
MNYLNQKLKIIKISIKLKLIKFEFSYIFKFFNIFLNFKIF